ncbi:MAG: nucleotidyltransferase domain-containing protein [Pseudomonadota bacterium]
MSKNQAKKIAAAYARKLLRHGFPGAKVFLFGSQAKGTAHHWSDIDVCVVSKRFSGKKWDWYEKQLWYARRSVNPHIEPIGMSPDEFENVSPLAEEIRKTGIRVA